jgi:hypothetical protein
MTDARLYARDKYLYWLSRQSRSRLKRDRLTMNYWCELYEDVLGDCNVQTEGQLVVIND